MLISTWFFPLIISAVTYIGLSIFLNRHLRLHHHDTWLKQGQPTIWNNSPANGLRFVQFFIFTSRYKVLNDRPLAKYVIVARVLMIVGFFFFAMSIFSIFA